MKLLCCIILQILAITSVSGQRSVSPELPKSSDLSLHNIKPDHTLEQEKPMPEEDNASKEIRMNPIDSSQRGLRGGRRLYRETNVGNGGNARTGDAYGPYGTTGHARGGDGGDGNVVIQSYRRHCGRRCRRYGPYYGYGGATNVGNGGNAQTGDAYGPYGTTGNARGGDGGDGNIVVQTRYGDGYSRYPYWDPYPYYGGTTNVGNGGDARTGDAYGPFGSTGNARGGDGGNGNVVLNGGRWWD